MWTNQVQSSTICNNVLQAVYAKSKNAFHYLTFHTLEEQNLDLFDFCLTNSTSNCELHLTSVKHNTNTYAHIQTIAGQTMYQCNISYRQLITQVVFKILLNFENKFKVISITLHAGKKSSDIKRSEF